MCPDGILGSLKMLEILDKSGKTVSELAGEMPAYHTVRETLQCEKGQKEKNAEDLAGRVKALKGVEKVTEIDGTRADFEDAWALVRASGTEPKIRVTVEARSEKRAAELLEKIRKAS